LKYQKDKYSKNHRKPFSFLFSTEGICSLKLLIFLLAGFLWIGPASAQTVEPRQAPEKKDGPYKVAILPVTINSPENVDFMREGLIDMLSSRVDLSGRVSVLEKRAVKKSLSGISGDMDSEAAKELGTQLGADYVVFGSLTKLGDSASLDLKVVDVKGEKPASSVFVQAQKMEEIIAAVDDIANQVDEKILGYSPRPPVVAKAKAPEKVKETAVIPAPLPGFQSPAPVQPQPQAVGGGQFSQSFPFPFLVTGMAIGDVDGDGRNEIVFIEERNLWIYRYEDGFKLLKKIEGARINKNLAVDVGDIDKDGKAEIVVTSYQGDLYGKDWRIASFVVAHKDGDFKVVASDLDWFLRVVNWGDRGPVLLGQGRGFIAREKGFQLAFDEAIYEMGWEGKKLKNLRRASLPKIYSLYGFAIFTYEGKTNYAFIDSDFRLKVADLTGSIIWRSAATFGSMVSFRVRGTPGGAESAASDEGEEFAFINPRVISRGKEILIAHNISSTIGGVLKRGGSYSSGAVQSLVWNGAMFMENWRSPTIPGYLADMQFQAIDSRSGNQLVVSVNLPKEGILSRESQSALMIARMQ
jgi:TolB-like protein